MINLQIKDHYQCLKRLQVEFTAEDAISHI